MKRNFLRLPIKDRIDFLDKMSMYINAGLRLDDSVVLCSFGMNKKYIKDIKIFAEDISRGETLSSLLKSTNYSLVTINIIRIGEVSGTLANSFRTACVLLERESIIKKKIFSSMTYPITIGVFSLCLVIGLMRGVMPEIVPMLESMKVQLPIITRLNIFVSDFIVGYGIQALVLSAFLLLLGIFIYKKSFLFRYLIHSILLNTPILNSVLRKISLSIFMRSFGSMLVSSINISEACNYSIESISMLPMRKKYSLISQKIVSGSSLSEIIVSIDNRLPPFISGLLLAGEKSGSLAVSMIRIADILDSDLEYSMKKLTSIIEPILMIMMGSVVAMIALSIVMPIYDMSKMLQR